MARRHGVFRAQEAIREGISSSVLTRLVREGILLREAHGVYRLPDYPITEQDTLVEVALRAPNAVFCLLTALEIHELTMQNPPDIWLAIRRGTHPPNLDIMTTVVRVSEPAFSRHIETFRAYGRELRVTSAARTVADCFKFRSLVGLEVAIEALRDFLATRRHELPQLREAAETVRVRSVLHPYLTALL